MSVSWKKFQRELSIPKSSLEMASLLVAYCLWLLGGLGGLHHLYLERYCHAFAWFATVGSFGVGWLFDFFELPNYVEERNNVGQYIDDHVNSRRPPRCSTLRFVGQLVLGYWLGELTILALPMTFWGCYFRGLIGSVTVSLGIAWGVYIAGNIGLQERRFQDAFVGAWPLSCVLLILAGSDASILYSVILSTVACNRTAKWRSVPAPYSLKTFGIWLVMYWILWFGVLLFNVRLIINGRMVTLGSALFEGSSQSAFEKWTEFRDYMAEAEWDKMRNDFKSFLHHFASTATLLSPKEIENAYKVVGLDGSSSKRDVKSRCRHLMREYHPDRTKDGQSDDFLKIQQACDVLTRTPSHGWRSREDL